MKTLFYAVLTLLALAIAPTAVFAGGGNNGGGTKQTGTITVQNNTDDDGNNTEIVAVLAPENATLSNLEAQLSDPSATRASIRAAAAQDRAQVRFISAGNSASFTGLKAGTHQLIVADLAGIAEIDSTTINISNGQTRTVSVTSDGGSLFINGGNGPL